MRILAAPCLLLLFAVTPAAGQRPQPVDALDGLDPVLLVEGKEVPGKSAHAAVRGQFTYLFSTPDTKATFERDPQRYEIQLGGICARMGRTAGGNPSDFIVHEGRIYIFGSDDCHKRFKEAPQKYLPPARAPLPRSAEATRRARALLDSAARALGSASKGAAKIDALASYVETSSQVQKRPQGEVAVSTSTTWSFPAGAGAAYSVRQERTQTLMGKTMTNATVASPAGQWFVGAAGQVFPMTPAGRPSLEQDFGRHPVVLLRRRHAADVTAAALAATTIDGVRVRPVRIVSGGLDVTLNVDPAGRPHSVTFVDRNVNGEYGRFTVLYSDFRAAGGLTLPFASRTHFNGAEDAAGTITVNKIDLDVAVDPQVFAPRAPSRQP
jgi:YHS domain-containing protein